MDQETPPTQRINKALLSQKIGSNVKLVGKVISESDRSALLECSDGGQVTVNRAPSAEKYTTKFVEIIGKVNDDQSVQEYAWTAWGDDFALDTYDDAVTLMQSFPHIFAVST